MMPSGTSPITTRQHKDGVGIKLRPLGFFRGSKGFGVFAMFWLCFVSIWTAIVFSAVINELQRDWSADSLVSLAFLATSLPFWAIGIWLFFYARSMGRRTSSFDVVGSRLLITVAHQKGAASLQLEASNIVSIALGPSNVTSNDEPLNELHIRLREPLPKRRNEAAPTPGTLRSSRYVVALLIERSDDTIREVAATLNEALQLDNHAHGQQF